MELIRQATDSEMRHTWLKSEWFRISHQHPNIDRKILDSPNFEDERENELRKRLLAHRGPILDHLPQDITWHAIEIEQSDTNKLYIIPIFDWFLDTGGTFRLVDTLGNLAPNRGYFHPERGTCAVDHFNEVARKLSFWESNKSVIADERLVLVATSNKGPFTIIDGTHRSAAYLKKDENTPTIFPWEGYLGVSPNCRVFRWHIESDGARQHIEACKTDVSRGLLW